MKQKILSALSRFRVSSFHSLLVLALVLCARVEATDTLYSTGSGSALYSIDPGTGLGTYIGNFTYSGVFALAFSPNGTLYAMSNGFGNGMLDQVNPATGASTHVGGPTGVSGILAMKFAPDGTLYAASLSTNMLYTIDLATGIATPVGNLGFSGVMDIAFDSKGQLYGLSNNLYKINRTTGAGTLFTALSDGNLMALTIDPLGRFLATDYSGNSPLYQINTATGALTSLGITGIPYSMALTERFQDFSPVATTLEVKGAAVAGAGIPKGAFWTALGVPCVTSSGDTFYAATLMSGKVGLKGIVLQDETTGDVTELVQAGAAVPGISGATFSSFNDPIVVSTGAGQEVMAYLATIAGASVTKVNNQVLVRNSLSSGAISGTEVLGQDGVVIGGMGIEVSKFTSVGLGPDGTVWALVTLVPGVGGVTTTNNIAVLSWAPGVSAPVAVLSKGQSLILSDGKTHVVSTIATLASAPGSPGQGRWEGPEGLIARVGFVDGVSAILTTTSSGTLTEVARNGGTVTLLDPTGAVQATGAQWSKFGLPSLDLNGGTTFAAVLAAKVGGVTSNNATGIFRQESGSSQWTALVRMGEATGLSDSTVFSTFNDPVSNGAGTVAFIATQIAGTAKTTALWSSAVTGTGPSASRVLTQVAALGQTAPETGGGVFASFVSVALPEWQSAGPLLVATMQTGAKGAAGPGGVTTATKTGLWGVDYGGNLRLLLQTGSPLPGAPVPSLEVGSFTVLKAVAGSAGQGRATDGLREVTCNVTFVNGETAVVKIRIP